jgi:hypothetical protein
MRSDAKTVRQAEPAAELEQAPLEQAPAEPVAELEG